MEGKVVARYHGVDVILSCGYYYPDVNGDIEKKSIKEVKEWIEDCWLFAQSNIYDLAISTGVDKTLLWNFFTNLK